MSFQFYVEADPSEELCRKVSNLSPENPYHTFEYLEARRTAGAQPMLLLLCEDGQLVSGCPVFLHSRLLSRTLEIESLSSIQDNPIFWDQLMKFCHKSGISGLGIYTAASTSAKIPAMPGEAWRKARTEYVIELRNGDLWKSMHKGHRWNINRSRKAGVSIVRTVDSCDWHNHIFAVRASMERRKSRGESVTMVKQTNVFDALVERGCGEMFQAVLNGSVLSSAFLAKGERGVYYLWAGTTAEGMAMGASHFLVYEISKKMQEESFNIFNLGGAYPEDKGLVLFKKGFGATEVNLESAEFCFGNRVRRRFGRAIDLFLDDPREFLKRGIRYLWIK